MFNPVRSRLSLAVGVLLAVAAMPAAAGSSLEDTLALSMSKGLRDRMFWNLSVVSTKTKTKSEEPRDQFAGGVVSIADLKAMRDAMAAGQATLDPNSDLYKINAAKLANVYSYGVSDPISAIDLLESALVADYGFAPRSGTTPGNGYLGTPKGILAKAGDPSATAALSVGYYLDDGQHWAVEALVLGAPLRAKVYGAGTNDRGEPNQMVGKELINTKMLPPLAKFGYYFGDRSWPVRPYLGVGAMYAIFFDTKATNFFNQYQGGKTSVSIKNAFGVGPFVGLESGASDSGWRVGFSVGRIKLKTEATLVTRNTQILSGADVLKDYGTNTLNAINIGEDTLAAYANLLAGFGPTLANGDPVKPFPNGLTTELMKDLAAYKQNRGGDGSLGTFVRKQKTELSNTIFMLNVGRSF